LGRYSRRLQDNLWEVDVDPFARNIGIRRAKRTLVPGVSSKCANHAREITREKNIGTRWVVMIGPAADEIARATASPASTAPALEKRILGTPQERSSGVE
jgi:hypothetical protein